MLAVVLLVVGLIGGFVGGMQYQKGQISTSTNGNGVQFRRGAGGLGANGFRATLGTILNADASTMTVKLQDGSSKIVILNSKTTIGKTTEATATDLTAGQTVQVFGTTNSDGSVTASNIQLNPIMRQRPEAGGTVTPATKL